jgi:hypothetical protein
MAEYVANVGQLWSHRDKVEARLRVSVIVPKMFQIESEHRIWCKKAELAYKLLGLLLSTVHERLKAVDLNHLCAKCHAAEVLMPRKMEAGRVILR